MLATVSPMVAQQPARSVASIAGCYQLQIGRWSPPSGKSYRILPEIIRLGITIDNKPEKIGFYRYGQSTNVFPAEPNSWSLSADSVRMAWSTGLAGFTMLVAAHGDSLIGTVHEFTDVITPGEIKPTAQVVAVRTVCPKS